MVTHARGVQQLIWKGKALYNWESPAKSFVLGKPPIAPEKRLGPSRAEDISGERGNANGIKKGYNLECGNRPELKKKTGEKATRH